VKPKTYKVRDIKIGEKLGSYFLEPNIHATSSPLSLVQVAQQ